MDNNHYSVLQSGILYIIHQPKTTSTTPIDQIRDLNVRTRDKNIH
jgi:hypothetical protein